MSETDCINEQIKSQLAELKDEVNRIGYGEFVKKASTENPIFNINGKDLSGVIEYECVGEAGRSLDGSMHRTILRPVYNKQMMDEIISGMKKMCRL